MADYIERDALIKRLEVTPLLKYGIPDYVRSGIIDLAGKQPAADVAPVGHGRWEKTEDDFYMGLTIFKCSVCREEWVFEDMSDVDRLNYHYCPNCGARMDGE